MPTSLHFIRKLEVRYSLLNLSVYNLVEKFTRYILTNVNVNNNNLLNTINLHIKLRKLKERKARLDSLLDSNNYYLDSSLDINFKNNLKNKKVIIVKNFTRE
ncbi:hypothetical protein HBH77_244740 [Parastagonospora nodorum]|nr:hypothetical protein HBH77_244740 [Parastagonospora nodorum]